MKVIILSAGRGERLRPLTDLTPKPLLKAGQYRLIEYIIKSLVKAGLDQIIINTAHLAAQFPLHLGDGQQYNANIQYSCEPLGGLETAGGIINALPLLGDEPFLVVNGDIWTDYPFDRLANFSLNEACLAHMVLVDNPPHNLSGDFCLSQGMVQQQGSDKLTYSGIAIYHPQMFQGLDVQRLALKPLLLTAISQQQLSGEYYQGQWSDIGTIERLQQLSLELER